jgi:hypothetical protein
MKKIAFIAVALLATLVSCKTTEVEQEVKLDEIVQVHQGAFAFCGASAAVPTGKKIIVQGVEFDEGCAICPVLTGPSISNLAMHGFSGIHKLLMEQIKPYGLSFGTTIQQLQYLNLIPLLKSGNYYHQ